MLNISDAQLIMIDKKVTGIKFIHEGKNKEVKAPIIICDPSYVLDCNSG